MDFQMHTCFSTTSELSIQVSLLGVIEGGAIRVIGSQIICIKKVNKPSTFPKYMVHQSNKIRGEERYYSRCNGIPGVSGS
jgi:hypothetical protein